VPAGAAPWGGMFRAERELDMSLEYAIGLGLSLLLIVYLVYALLKPEKF
jgi:K+-transporting ATPase KdpF subunit